MPTDSKLDTVEVAVQTEPKIVISVATYRQVEMQDTCEEANNIGWTNLSNCLVTVKWKITTMFLHLKTQ